jgi:putative protease
LNSCQANPTTEQAVPSPVVEPVRTEGHTNGLPELLSPAGDWDCVRAAVENGADAIYFGLDKFNARMRAHNFTEADLPKLMEFLHRRGVKGYLTFNTLVFENEMVQAEQYLRTVIAAGVDAAIVQDVGICRLIRQLSPDFPIHVSTQMTVTSRAGVEFARELGCNLVVLARECSLKEIEKIAAGAGCRVSDVGGGEKPEDRGSKVSRQPLPLEVFVHGALCVAYSGQCLTSEALGGRSANRGECAQACRMPYELVADGKEVPLGDRKYLLSPQDLAGLELLRQLVAAGVASLKIEGRLKSPEYVANITRIYRRALDEIGCRVSGVGCQVSRGEAVEAIPEKRKGRAADSLTERDSQYEMEMAFSRGLYTGWFRGINNQRLVHAHFGKKRGVYLGKVLEVRRDCVLLELEGPVKAGDGVVFDAGKPEEKEEGGRVYEIRSRPGPGRLSELRFGHGDIEFARVHAGDKLWKTSDPELERRLRQSFEGTTPRFQRPISFEIHGLRGKPLTLFARDESGHVARVDSAMPLVPAETQPLTTERLREQLGRLGGTPFLLGDLKNQLEGEVMLPVSELNRMRREAVEELERLRATPLRWALNSKSSPSRTDVPCPSAVLERSVTRRVTDVGALDAVGAEGSTEARNGRAPRLIVLVRNLAQLEATLEKGVETIYCEFEDPKKYREAVEQFRKSAFRTSRSEIFVAPPRIFKMGEEWTLKQVGSCEADGYLVRNYDHLEFFADERCIGDYSLNIANRLAAEYFKNQFGLERVTASYDLNFEQLHALLAAAPVEWFEVTLHQHMPMFHMEHCVFCAFLSKGTDYTNCGRPCDKHDLKLRDRVGAEHPVKADAGCRNTVFNALAQTGADYVGAMLELGVKNFRLEFLNETAEQVGQTISKYGQLLLGEVTGAEVWRELKLLNQLGVTRGQIAKR